MPAPIAAERRRGADRRPVAAGGGCCRTGSAPYLARNAAVAVALARDRRPAPLPADAVAGGLAHAALPGRAEMLEGDPPLLVDAAHNEAGRAGAGRGAAGAGGRPAADRLPLGARRQGRGAIVAALAPALDGCVCTAADPGPAMGRPGSRAMRGGRAGPPARGGGVEVEVVADPGSRRRAGPRRWRASGAGWRSSPVRITFCGTHGPRGTLRTPLDDGPGGRRGRRRDPRLLRPRLPVRASVPLKSARPASGRRLSDGVTFRT